MADNSTQNIEEEIKEAQASEANFHEEIEDTPKPAIQSDGAPQTEPTTNEAAPVEQGSSTDIFGSDLWSGGIKHEEPEQVANDGPALQQSNTVNFQPFQPPKVDTSPATGTGDAEQDFWLERSKNMEDVIDIVTSNVLAMLDGDAVPEQYEKSEPQKMKLAKALAKMKPKFVGEMSAQHEYLMIAAAIYAPVATKAMKNRKINIRNKKAIAAGEKMGVVANQKAKVVELDNTGKAERTRFEIHGNGTYRYGRPPHTRDYFGVDNPRAEKVDLENIEHLKKIVLNKQNGGWKKVADSLGVSHDWMVERGLNTDKPD